VKKKIIEIFKIPLKEKKARFDILIGGVLLMIPVVQFFSIGYLTKKLKKIIELEKNTIKWDENLKELFIFGVKGTALLLIYLFIPFLFMFLGGFFISFLSKGKILSLFFFRGQILIITGTVLLLIIMFFFPAGICLYLEENSIKKAVDFKSILEKIILIPKEYGIVYFIILGIYLFSIVLTFILFNWVIGILSSGFIYFYDGFVSVHLIGKFFPRKSIKIPQK